jgi:methylenetetrahydrofolate reductase (NADPH)
MRIRDLFASNRPVFSFEFFPPKTAEGEEKLMATVHRLTELGPSFVSVTKTGGSPAEKTIELTARLKHEVGVEAMAHMTCATAGRQEMRRIFELIRDAGIENVLPLRGDPPADQPDFVRPPDGFGFANELVQFIRGHDFPFCLAGAAYPEKHPQAPSLDADLRNLKTKVDAGVDVLITQMFYRNADYFAFVERARAVGITVPIVAGIMPITNVAQIERIAKLSGAVIPADLQADLDRTRGDEAGAREAGVAYAIGQCRELLRGGAPGVHFYTLNQSTATSAILRDLRRDYP